MIVLTNLFVVVVSFCSHGMLVPHPQWMQLSHLLQADSCWWGQPQLLQLMYCSISNSLQQLLHWHSQFRNSCLHHQNAGSAISTMAVAPTTAVVARPAAIRLIQTTAGNEHAAAGAAASTETRKASTARYGVYMHLLDAPALVRCMQRCRIC